MNKYIKAFIIFAALPISVLVPAFVAQTFTLDSQVYAQQSSLQERVEGYKNNLATPPTKTELDRAKLRCGVSQTVLKEVQGRLASVQEGRDKAYGAIGDALETLEEALVSEEYESSELTSNRQDLTSKLGSFNNSMANYKQAIDDAVSLNCEEDPLALLAAIDSARRSHEQLVGGAADLRSYVNNVIKTTLQQVKSDLEVQHQAAAGEPTEDLSIEADEVVVDEEVPSAAQ